MFKRIKRKIITAGLAVLLLGCSDSGKVSGPTRPPPVQPPTQPQNRNPTFSNSCPVTVDENRNYECIAPATDADGDALTYSVTSPSWLSVNSSTGTITGIAPEVSTNQSFNIIRNVSDGRGGSASQNYDLTVSNLFNTHILLTDQLSGLAVTDSNLAFSQPVNFAVGDIIASGITTQTPYGLFREITSFSLDRRTVRTTQASLEDVVRDASLNYTHELTPSDIQSFSPRFEGVSMTPRSSAESQDFNFGVSLTNVLLYDRDGRTSTTDDQIIANGNISFNTGFDFNINVRGFRLNEVKFEQRLGEVADISIGSNLWGWATQQEVKIAEYKFAPILLGILPTFPPIPVIVVPKIEINVGINPSRTNPLSMRVRQDASLTGRLTYNGTWDTSVDFSNNFNFSIPNPTGDWDFTAYAGPTLNLSLFGIAGPSASVSARLRLGSTNSDWKLYGGLGASVGISVDILSKRIAAYFKEVLSREWLLAGRETPLPSTGKILFARVIGNNADIYTMNPDGSNSQNLTNSSSFWDVYPSCSSDGTQILYSSKIPFSTDDFDIYRMNADGTNKIALTTSSMDETNPVFSPDATRIAYSAGYSSGYEQMYVMNSNGSSPVQIINDSGHYYWDLFWYPGLRIAFFSNRDHSNGEIYTVNSDGSDIRRLTNNSYYDRFPSWSPDRSKIAFATNRDGNYEIYIMNADGSNPINISNSPTTSDDNPSWSPDGNKIVYVSRTLNSSSEYNEIYIMNADGSNKTRITNNNYDDGSPIWCR